MVVAAPEYPLTQIHSTPQAQSAGRCADIASVPSSHHIVGIPSTSTFNIISYNYISTLPFKKYILYLSESSSERVTARNDS